MSTTGTATNLIKCGQCGMQYETRERSGGDFYSVEFVHDCQYPAPQPPISREQVIEAMAQALHAADGDVEPAHSQALAYEAYDALVKIGALR